MTRRRLLSAGAGLTVGAGLAGIGLGAVTAPFGGAAQAAVPTLGQIGFDVFRNGSAFGNHAITFSQLDPSTLQVDIEIDLQVNLGFVPVFRYSHRNSEQWRDGRLITLQSSTNDDGRRYALTAVAEGDSLVIDGDEGRLTGPADLMTTSYWHRGIVNSSRLLDTQRGRILEVEFAERELQTLPVAGQNTPARRYEMTGDLRVQLWYGEDSPTAGELMKIAFSTRGSDVAYRRVV